jgi:large subunit ribosomal protein L19
MNKKTENFLKSIVKKNLPDIRPGDTVQVHQKIKEGDKERIQIFGGLVMARKHGKTAGATVSVRRIISGIGVERIFPIHSPTIEKIELLKRGKVRRAKLYYLRSRKGKKARIKKEESFEATTEKKAEQELKKE